MKAVPYFYIHLPISRAKNSYSEIEKTIFGKFSRIYFFSLKCLCPSDDAVFSQKFGELRKFTKMDEEYFSSKKRYQPFKRHRNT